MLESPTNPRMAICDIRAICALAHEVSSTRHPAYKVPTTCNLIACYKQPFTVLHSLNQCCAGGSAGSSGQQHIGAHVPAPAGLGS